MSGGSAMIGTVPGHMLSLAADIFQAAETEARELFLEPCVGDFLKPNLEPEPVVLTSSASANVSSVVIRGPLVIGGVSAGCDCILYQYNNDVHFGMVTVPLRAVWTFDIDTPVKLEQLVQAVETAAPGVAFTVFRSSKDHYNLWVERTAAAESRLTGVAVTAALRPWLDSASDPVMLAPTFRVGPKIWNREVPMPALVAFTPTRLFHASHPNGPLATFCRWLDRWNATTSVQIHRLVEARLLVPNALRVLNMNAYLMLDDNPTNNTIVRGSRRPAWLIPDRARASMCADTIAKIRPQFVTLQELESQTVLDWILADLVRLGYPAHSWSLQGRPPPGSAELRVAVLCMTPRWRVVEKGTIPCGGARSVYIRVLETDVPVDPDLVGTAEAETAVDHAVLERIVAYQSGVGDKGATYDVAIEELKTGMKRNHWIWWVFPKCAPGLTSRLNLRLPNLATVRAYLQHPVLSQRLLEATRIVHARLSSGTPIVQLLRVVYAFEIPEMQRTLACFALAARHEGLVEEAQLFAATGALVSDHANPESVVAGLPGNTIASSAFRGVLAKEENAPARSLTVVAFHGLSKMNVQKDVDAANAAFRLGLERVSEHSDLVVVAGDFNLTDVEVEQQILAKLAPTLWTGGFLTRYDAASGRYDAGGFDHVVAIARQRPTVSTPRIVTGTVTRRSRAMSDHPMVTADLFWSPNARETHRRVIAHGKENQVAVANVLVRSEQEEEEEDEEEEESANSVNRVLLENTSAADAKRVLGIACALAMRWFDCSETAGGASDAVIEMHGDLFHYNGSLPPQRAIRTMDVLPRPDHSTESSSEAADFASASTLCRIWQIPQLTAAAQALGDGQAARTFWSSDDACIRVRIIHPELLNFEMGPERGVKVCTHLARHALRDGMPPVSAAQALGAYLAFHALPPSRAPLVWGLHSDGICLRVAAEIQTPHTMHHAALFGREKLTALLSTFESLYPQHTPVHHRFEGDGRGLFFFPTARAASHFRGLIEFWADTPLPVVGFANMAVSSHATSSSSSSSSPGSARWAIVSSVLRGSTWIGKRPAMLECVALASESRVSHQGVPSRSIALLGSSSAVSPANYVALAERTAELLTRLGFSLIYGGQGVPTGTNDTVMTAFVRGAALNGGHTTGVITRQLAETEETSTAIPQLVLTDGLATRKTRIFEPSHASVFLPGAVGTLDELLTVLECKHQGEYLKPIAILNTDAFFDPLLDMFERIRALDAPDNDWRVADAVTVVPGNDSEALLVPLVTRDLSLFDLVQMRCGAICVDSVVALGQPAHERGLYSVTTNPTIIEEAVRQRRYWPWIATVRAAATLASNEPGRLAEIVTARIVAAMHKTDIVGIVYLQVDVRHTSADAIVAATRRMFNDCVLAGTLPDRLCVKIPLTSWQAVEAIRRLVLEGVRCCATLVLTLEQAIAASEAGAYAVILYMNDLEAHLPGQSQTARLVTSTLARLQRSGSATRVLIAAISSVQAACDLAALPVASRAQLSIPTDVIEELERLGPDSLLSRILAPAHAPEPTQCTDPNPITQSVLEAALRAPTIARTVRDRLAQFAGALAEIERLVRQTDIASALRHVTVRGLPQPVPCLVSGTHLQTVDGVRGALQAGFRFFDTATMYSTHEPIRTAVRDSGIPRDQLTLCSKASPMISGRDAIIKWTHAEIARLDCRYLDVAMPHWPTEAIDVLDTIRGLEEMQRQGYVRGIGVSNLAPECYEAWLEGRTPTPLSFVELAFNPLENTTEMLRHVRFYQARGLTVMGYHVFAMGRALYNPTVVWIARAHARTPAQVLLRWSLGHGVLPIVKSACPQHHRENAAAFDFDLAPHSAAELDALATPSAYDQTLRKTYG